MTAIETKCMDCGKDYRIDVPPGALGYAAKLIQTPVCEECRMRRDENLRAEEDLLRLRTLEQRKFEFWAKSGIPSEYVDKGFKDFEPEFDNGRHKESLKVMQDWAETFNPRKASEAPSILLFGSGITSYGTGKTHLATSTLRRVVADLDYDNAMGFGNPIHFTTAADALLRISAARIPDFAGGSKESEESVYRDLTAVRLLCLDDVGKERPRRDLEEFYFTVINRRYSNGLPLIMTSNVPPERMKGYDGPILTEIIGEAAVSRLRVMAAGYWIPMDGPDYRRTQAKRKVSR